MVGQDILFYASYAILVTAGIYDLLTGRIPNYLSYGGIAVGLLLSLFLGGLAGFGGAFAAMLFAAFPFLLAFAFGGGGGGDVKLMAAAGALLGFPLILDLLAHSLLVGGVIALCLIALRYLKRSHILLVLVSKPLALLPKNAMPDLLPVQAEGPHRVRFGIAVALGFIWINTPGVWTLPSL